MDFLGLPVQNSIYVWWAYVNLDHCGFLPHTFQLINHSPLSAPLLISLSCRQSRKISHKVQENISCKGTEEFDRLKRGS